MLARFAPWVVLVVGIALSGMAYHHWELQLKREAASIFEKHCRDIQRAFEIRLASYEGLLLGLRRLYQASEMVTRRQFRDYIMSLGLPARYPAVASMNYAQEVTAQGKRVFEETIRKDKSLEPSGYPTFKVSPPGEREQYHVLIYIEAFDGGTAGLGRDVRVARPGNERRLDEMRESGEVASSGELVPGVPGRSLALRAPIYERGVPVDTVEQRRRAFLGSVGMGFSLLRLVDEVVPPSVRDIVRFRIHNLGQKTQPNDLAPASEDNLLVDSDMVAASGKLRFASSQSDFVRLTHSSTLVLGNRILGIYFEGSARNFATSLERAFSVVILVFGVTSSLLLFALIGSQLRVRLSLEAVVQERTRALEETNRNLRLEMDQRAQLEREILQIGHEERRKIGEELHNDLGQKLTAAAFLAESLARDLKQDAVPGADQAFRIEKYLSEAVLQTRTLAKGLYPVAPEERSSVVHALEQLVAETEQVFRIRCRLRCSGVRASVDPDLALNLYRIAQEAILNAVKHGRASTVLIELSDKGGRPKMTIVDNGVGFDERAAQGRPGLGLQIMRHRCNMLGLSLSISSIPGAGSVLCVE